MSSSSSHLYGLHAVCDVLGSEGDRPVVAAVRPHSVAPKEAEHICFLSNDKAQLISFSQPPHLTTGASEQRIVDLNVGRPECVAWSLTGDCVVIGDSAGKLHFMSQDGRLVYSQMLTQSVGGKCFISVEWVGKAQETSATVQEVYEHPIATLAQQISCTYVFPPVFPRIN